MPETFRDHAFPKGDTCFPTVCGDGKIQGAEECDDFNAYNNDGCSSECLIEPQAQLNTGFGALEIMVYPRAQKCRLENGYQIELFEEDLVADFSPAEIAAELAGIDPKSDEYQYWRDTNYTAGLTAEELEKVRADALAASEAIDYNLDPNKALINRYTIRNRAHETVEDAIYNLKHTVLTGDVKWGGEDFTKVKVNVKVREGFITLLPLEQKWLNIDKLDANRKRSLFTNDGLEYEEIIVTEDFESGELRETRYDYRSQSSNFNITGRAEFVDRWLRDNVYFQPKRDYVGVDVVTFSMIEGLGFPDGQTSCKLDVFVRVVAADNDDPPVIFVNTSKMINFTDPSLVVPGPPDYQHADENYFTTLADPFGKLNRIPYLSIDEDAIFARLPGIEVADPDCGMIRDGSCYLNLTLDGQESLDLNLAGQIGRVLSIQAQDDNLNLALNQLRVTPVAQFSGFCNVTVSLARVITKTRTQDMVRFATIVKEINVFVRPQDDRPVLLFGFPNHRNLFHGSILDLAHPEVKGGMQAAMEAQKKNADDMRIQQTNSSLPVGLSRDQSLLYNNMPELQSSPDAAEFPRVHRGMIEQRPGYFVYDRVLEPPIIWENLMEVWDDDESTTV